MCLTAITYGICAILDDTGEIAPMATYIAVLGKKQL